MKSFRKIVAVTLVTAFCFIVCVIPASAALPSLEAPLFDYYNEGYLFPSPTYPDAESLPYGSDTLVYDLIQRGQNGLIVYRFYVKDVRGDGSFDNYTEGSTVMLSCSSVDYFHFLVSCPNYPIYSEQLAYLDDDGYTVVYSSGVTESVYSLINGVKVYFFNLYGTFSPYEGDYSHLISYPLYYRLCTGNSSFFFNGNVLTSDNINTIPSNLWDELDIKNTVFVHPTLRNYVTTAMRDEIFNNQIKESIDDIGNVLQDGFDEVIENNNQNADKIVGSIDSASGEIKDSIVNSAGEIQTAINGAVDDIMNGASEVPTVDTDNSWMNESVTKMNEWLSELEAFEEQMKQNEEENSENMQQASNFVNGFFDSIPTALTAALSLALVMIVVIKIVGR